MNNDNKKTILLVEDEIIIAMSEKSDLEEYGYTVMLAQSGEEAIAISETDGIADLILMDIDLGKGIDGTEAARLILLKKDIPIVFLSSHIEPEIVKKTEAITSYGYVVKNSGKTILDASIKMAFKLFNANKLSEQKEEKFRLMVKNSNDSYVLINRDGEQFYISDAAVRDTGFKIEELKGPLKNVIYPDDLDIVLNAWNDVITKKNELIKVRYRHKHKTNGYIWYEAVAQNYLDNPSINAVVVNVRDITEWKRDEEKVADLLAEKETILREVHHRMKNNMNTVSALLSLQISATKENTIIDALRDTQSRVRCMMLLYEKLFHPENKNKLPASIYLASLVDEIADIFPAGKKIKIEKNITEFVLDEKRLQHLGIIINELITNIMKHAFTGKDDGIISIASSLQGKNIILEIEDNGNGMPKAIDFSNSMGVGLTLIKAMMSQISGSIKIERGIGTKFILEFPIEK